MSIEFIFFAALGVAILLGLRKRRKLAAEIEHLTGRVDRVIDGDTIVVRGMKIRLAGIDAPEMGQQTSSNGFFSLTTDAGRSARVILSDLIKGQTVDVEISGLDHYGRAVGSIRLNGRDVNLEMIRLGYAVAASNPSREYRAAERKARSTKSGLWSVGGFERPAAYRHS